MSGFKKKSTGHVTKSSELVFMHAMTIFYHRTIMLWKGSLSGLLKDHEVLEKNLSQNGCAQKGRLSLGRLDFFRQRDMIKYSNID